MATLAARRDGSPRTESPVGSGSSQWCVQSLRSWRELMVGFGRWDAMRSPSVGMWTWGTIAERQQRSHVLDL